MTQDEIKEGLECCAKSYGDDVHCSDCPYDTLTPRACCERFCQDVLCKDALNLITEQEKEIERLKAEFKQLETNAEILARGVRDLNHENYELTEKVKQAQIDILNELKKYLHAEDFDTPDERWKPESEFCAIIDKMLKEVQNAENKS